jgi:ribonuclease P protein component
LSGRPARVEGRRQFGALVRAGRRARKGAVTVHFVGADEADDQVRVAYSVGRRVGGAVVRNQWRRRLRAIAAELTGELHPGCYLIVVAPDVRQLTFQELKDQVRTTMRRASGSQG